MGRGMDDIEPAAATNSAVFGRNKPAMRCELSIRSPVVKSTFEAFDEAQAMTSERVSESSK